VPSYACPTGGNPDVPYLWTIKLAPGGTTIPDGFGVLGLGPIGMSIIATVGMWGGTGDAVANDTNFSGATNWQTKASSYQIQLYCSEVDGYISPSLTP
jgi:hypothetical protein